MIIINLNRKFGFLFNTKCKYQLTWPDFNPIL